jgi:glycosyltransferase involved in cell wall biosynthesis
VVLLLLGTICERKGQIDLVRALRHLDEGAARRTRCFVVGDRPSPYSEQLHAEVEGLPDALRQRIAIVSETGNTALYHSAADVFVCTSRVESFPRVVLEAMAYDLPVVTTPVFGIAEQVREGVNAMFYTPGDVVSLGGRIQEIVVNDDVRCRLAARARPMLDRLRSFDEMVSSYAELFREAYLSGGTQLQRADSTDSIR